MTWTSFPELDDVLAGLRDSAADILGDAFVGMYLQGSFALGAGDAQSDADFLVVVTTAPRGRAERELRRLHDEIPTRPGVWNRNLEGSYADQASLRDAAGLGVPWLFNDHGRRTLERDLHCNNHYTRWILRNHGIVLAGPPPVTLVDEVPREAIRAVARADVAGLMASITSWADMGHAWTQKYVVQTYSRLLYSATTGLVASKPHALGWAAQALDPEWWPLLRQVAEDRALPWRAVDPPRPGAMERALQYAAHVEAEVARL